MPIYLFLNFFSNQSFQFVEKYNKSFLPIDRIKFASNPFSVRVSSARCPEYSLTFTSFPFPFDRAPCMRVLGSTLYLKHMSCYLQPRAVQWNIDFLSLVQPPCGILAVLELGFLLFPFLFEFRMCGLKISLVYKIMYWRLWLCIGRLKDTVILKTWSSMFYIQKTFHMSIRNLVTFSITCK